MIESLVWNCLGVGNSSTMEHILDLVKKFNIYTVGLMEPTLSEKRIDSVQRKLQMDNGWCNSSSRSRIWIFWDNTVKHCLRSETAQQSTFLVDSTGLAPFYFTIFVYASSSHILR